MSYDKKRPLALIILDGWGISPNPEGNAIALAHTPYYDEICERFPFTTLVASGSRVGLPVDAPGNAEVGHRTIGAGRIVQTDAARIAGAVASGDLLRNEVLVSALGRAAAAESSVHFVGLLSDGGVHSSQETLFRLLRMAKLSGVTDAFVHGILDGRDVQPRTADIYVEALEIKISDIGIGKIASMCGRFYAMDSTEHWERTARAFTMMIHGEGERTFDAVTAIRASFLRGISDEFIAPIVIEQRMDEPMATIKDGDLVVFFNHKAEGMHQLVRSLAVQDATAAKPKIEAVCLTEYDPSFGLPVAFGEQEEKNMLATIFDYCGLRNYRITETSRSRHVSSYLNGRDQAGTYENRIILHSDGIESLETGPESRSFKIADSLLRGLDSDRSGVFVVNFPASDLVSAGGNIDKTVEAIQFVDTCLGGVIEKIKEVNGVAVITSSHAGCEEISEKKRFSRTPGATGNPVPFHIVDHENTQVNLAAGGSLEDVAPTMLGILGLNIPAEMTGRDLRL
ncbi:MAG: 2,3-bisphosphoglycerate-independent phosphoglycerate mutase [Acidobacteria bacterium]|nr:2,3-bisphosphoglycerate-independent phosphoglycerate mutase [Acidobacteriota bacterium]